MKLFLRDRNDPFVLALALVTVLFLRVDSIGATGLDAAPVEVPVLSWDGGSVFLTDSNDVSVQMHEPVLDGVAPAEEQRRIPEAEGGGWADRAGASRDQAALSPPLSATMPRLPSDEVERMDDGFFPSDDEPMAPKKVEAAVGARSWGWLADMVSAEERGAGRKDEEAGGFEESEKGDGLFDRNDDRTVQENRREWSASVDENAGLLRESSVRRLDRPADVGERARKGARMTSDEGTGPETTLHGDLFDTATFRGYGGTNSLFP